MKQRCPFKKEKKQVQNKTEKLLINEDQGYPRNDETTNEKEQQEQWTIQTDKNDNASIVEYSIKPEVQDSIDEFAQLDDIFMKDLLIKENDPSTRRRKRRKKNRMIFGSTKREDTFLINDTDSLTIICDNITVCDTRKDNDTNPTINETSVKWVTQNISKVLEEDAPFLGFEGSQKFPVKVTHKPPLVVPQQEKFDRRHFGPPKIDVQEPTELATSMEPPDLPKSPSRDVPLRRKTEEIESSTMKEEEEKEEENKEEKEKAEEEVKEEEEEEEKENIFEMSEISSTTTDDVSSNVDIVSTIKSTIFPILTSTSAIEKDPPFRENVERVVDIEETVTRIKEDEYTVTDRSVFEKINVTILGLFEMTRGQEPRSEGPTEFQAAKLAVDRINEMNILNKFYLRLIHNDTKLLQDTQLISLICILLVIDGLVVTLWVTLDPMQRHLRNLTMEMNLQDRGIIYQPQVEVCRSQHTNGWLGALYVYKGLLLVVGVYMAWETRHVKIPALNDSQYIGMSVYSVVITSGIVVVLANLMSDRATLAFVTITALILASTTGTLALLFLPQLANILAGERADPVVQSLGLKIECNTRRFVTDDRRELQYRVEVQNRVYRREMAQLELELARLEKQLAQEPVVEPSHASSSTSIPQRNPSIGGGLPLLLLSVLPSVIPRASWPSADPSGMRRGTVAFSSQPDLEPDGGPRRSLADIYKLHRRRETEGPNRLGVFQRLFSLFGSRPTSRKTSTASFTGVASALRVHMGYIAGLVPGAKAASTCQMDAQGSRQSHPRCGSGPIISITSEEDRRLSLGLRRKESSEPRVNFTLPPQFNSNQGSSREKIRGSPRFPHRIVPANSLSTIAPGLSAIRPHRWHSMEDARRPKTTSTPRGSSCSPLCDVWATHEVGIPLSELGKSIRGRKPPESLALTIKADSNISPDDVKLGNDLKRLFRESDVSSDVSPIETELSSTPTNLKLPSTINDVVIKNGSHSGSTTLTVVLTDTLQQEQECSQPTSPKILIAKLDEDILKDPSSNDQGPTTV
ncbi:hypothetical protein M0802_003362 [Mischocyttarus mexicanus]|nr:hypothetical protein M0802_003362 [Mischocyttarus mexicanus]